MNLLVLGRGKTGSLVCDVAMQRGHHVGVLGAAENAGGNALREDSLRDVDVVIDFTTPAAVVANIDACARARKNMVVGTTGWYGEMDHVRTMVQEHGIGFVYGANFSYGVNLFFEIAQIAADALKHSFTGSIEEIHHVRKKDAPSGTAAKIQQIVEQAAGRKLEITSIREGDVPGTHTIKLESDVDSLTLTHAAKSRRGFAEGAVMGAEWLQDKKGFYDFREIFHEVGI